ncbi:MAG TPA: FlgO family outer membrane protein [Candidatus Competibacteraceae bacterium]|nr:FlgO family outer membrane protein [Candidatus Competibacteraceae bacterium]HQA26750.1 FlgO family outer membrane protein [Candidatus Competibacteraceae bacterium]HQD56411.1 FlgO family outer membrane protein [Candidatus Competibacteraceae bacterium]
MSCNTILRVGVLCLSTLGLGILGCASTADDTPVRQPVQDANLVSANYGAADALLARASWLKERREPLLAATFVDINNLEMSSGLGRVIGEQVGSRFAQEGFTVVEIKMRNNIFVKEGAGEFMLSRSVKEISQSQNAAAVIAGTYAVGRQSVFVNARLIRATDSLVLASYDYVLPLGPDAKALLAAQ